MTAVTVRSMSGQGRSDHYFVIHFGEVPVSQFVDGHDVHTPQALEVMARISAVFPGVRFAPRGHDKHSLEMLPSRYDSTNGYLTAERVQAAANTLNRQEAA